MARCPVRTTVAGVALLATVGCRNQPATAMAAPTQPVPGLTLVPLEGGPAASTPNLTVGRTGIVALTWQQTAGESHSVRSRLRDASGQWGATMTVAESDALLVNWADFPVLLANGEGHRVASWLQRDGHGYGVQWSYSEDNGMTWAPGQWLHEHQGGPEYGFVSVTPTQTGGLAAFWLDGRESVGHHGGAMQLRGAEIGADGTVSARRLIDDRVCDCCQTSAASTAAGPVVVYRDRSAQEVRDISIAGPEPDQRRRVAADDWTIAGCPVNGPAVSASKAGLVVAWFTGASGKSAVRVAFGPLKGPFASPVAVDLGDPLGRVGVAWLDERHAVVSFIDQAGSSAGQASLVARVVGRDGSVGVPWLVAKTSSSNAAGFPRLVRTGEHLVWAWTDAAAGASAVRLAEARVDSLRPG